jgi:uncharacterized protein (DUF305 family)
LRSGARRPGRTQLAALAAGLLLLAGCSDGPTVAVDEDPPPPAPGAPATVNGYDVMFLQMMVPHLEQGQTILRLAKDRAGDEAVRTLAASIESTQAGEISTMSGLLTNWHQPATAPVNSHSGHGGMPNTTDREVAALGRMSGPEFDHRFLNVMIAHQDDAIQLATVETADGTDQQAKALADTIEASRTAQIHQMLAILGPA